MTNLQNALKELYNLFNQGADGESAFEQKLVEINNEFTSTSDKEIIKKTVCEMTSELGDMISDLSIKTQLSEIEDVLSFAYISRQYFGKSKNWLYQRINGNIINGKNAKFTQSEIETLNIALQDISQKIGSLRVH